MKNARATQTTVVGVVNGWNRKLSMPTTAVDDERRYRRVSKRRRSSVDDDAFVNNDAEATDSGCRLLKGTWCTCSCSV